MKFGVAQWCLPERGVESIRWAAENGFEAIQIDVGYASQHDPLATLPEVQGAYLEASRKWRVEITGMAVERLIDVDMASPPGSPDAREVEAAVSTAVQAATAMRIPVVQCSSFGASEIRDRIGFLRTADVIRTAVQHSLSLKGPLLATESSLGPAETVALVRAAGQRSVRVLLDVFNPVLWGHDLKHMIDAVWPYLLNQVHIKDGIGGEMGNCAVGAGIGGVRDSVRELISRGFAGYWILENEYGSDADLASRDSEVLSNWIAAAKQ